MGRRRGRPLVHAHRQVIARCLEAGHATSRIARFLRVSDTTVSRVATAMRSGPANPAATAFR
jgi:DNA invertase Pin-like site-specific DNA recombinase